MRRRPFTIGNRLMCTRRGEGMIQPLPLSSDLAPSVSLPAHLITGNCTIESAIGRDRVASPRQVPEPGIALPTAGKTTFCLPLAALNTLDFISSP
jgi:hypothetical protein